MKRNSSNRKQDSGGRAAAARFGSGGAMILRGRGA